MGKKKSKKKKPASGKRKASKMTEEEFTRLLQKFSESPPKSKL